MQCCCIVYCAYQLQGHLCTICDLILTQLVSYTCFKLESQSLDSSVNCKLLCKAENISPAIKYSKFLQSFTPNDVIFMFFEYLCSNMFISLFQKREGQIHFLLPC